MLSPSENYGMAVQGEPSWDLTELWEELQAEISLSRLYFPPVSGESGLARRIQTKQVKGKSLEILLIVENDPVMDTFVGNKLGQSCSN